MAPVLACDYRRRVRRHARARTAAPPMRTTIGLMTEATYMFHNMIRKLRASYKTQIHSRGLRDDLLDPRQHSVQLFLEALQGGLPHYIGRALYPVSNFLGEALGLADDSARRVQQLRITFLQFLLALLAPAARGARNVENSQFHTAAAIARLGAHITSNPGDLLHGAATDSCNPLGSGYPIPPTQRNRRDGLYRRRNEYVYMGG